MNENVANRRVEVVVKDETERMLLCFQMMDGWTLTTTLIAKEHP